jgi:hypothetical protein
MPPRLRVSRSRLAPVLAEVSPATPPRAPAKKATRSRALSVDTLEQLGVRQLAELLMAQAQSDPALARSLRLVLAGTDGASHLAAEVEKRLRTIQRSRGFIEWDKVRPLVRELEGLRETIAGPLAQADPRAAAAQMRLFLELAGSVFERSDDGSGSLGDVFREAGAELGRLWTLLPGRDPVRLAAELLALLDADGYGTTDRLLAASGPALGPDGRVELRRLLQARLDSLPHGRGRDDFGEPRGRFMVSLRLRELSDLEGDVDAYIAAIEAGGRSENFAGDIAERLIAHRRPAEALGWLDRAAVRHDEGRQIDLRIAALDALGRKAEAQDLRWTTFQRFLGTEHLRAYLRDLPDFDDVEAEEQAMEHALAHPDRNLALTFLVAWPNLKGANQLVRDHRDELDGGQYFRLRPAAEALAEKYPAAATLLHRALAEDVLRRASSRQYQYAVRDVKACAGLATLLPDEASLEPHEAFMARLRREHPRKTGFWSLLDPNAR